ncbi:LamG-like jellyroll fold domain-containing protein [Pseudoduganella namucuonensis]|uniref:Alginate lyase n=1 Tax=Pseudoduganella namucuonensis TaxID=1035707 RepID=A0A1I7M6H0_9BURK|nr:LamG-like jellyroll fold domain-containing protein [Pseudoduganella namucuonensis]SFV17535.1 Alginate lyase [Pseudoduganella namucuonensis]
MRQPEENVIENIAADISRRTFLYSLGALALAGCGGGLAGDGQGGSSSAGGAARQGGTPSGTFVHPGLLHTAADFTRMAAKYTTSPWSGSWSLLINNSHTNLSTPPRPVAIVYRGYDGVHPENYSLLYKDIAAAYGCALRWKVSGNTAYADKAVQIMNAWSGTLTAIRGTSDHQLAAGIYGYEFANAAEIMRGYSGWAAADFVRFQNMMLNVFYPINHDFLIRHNNTEITHYWANWDLCNLASILAISVLCDDQAKWDEAINYLKGESGNGGIGQAVYFLHPGYLGQWQETGRDQGHSALGIALLGAICEMAWNQGEDLYGYDNNRFLAGAEYVAKSNLLQSGTSTYNTVPYVRYNNVDNVNQTALNTDGQGAARPCWALVYNHYVNRKGLAAPYSKQWAQNVEGGGGNYGTTSGGYDQLGYGTLTCTLDPIASGAAPSGLTAYTAGGVVVLSWWGSAYATGYTVKRATTPGGPYTTVASGITDLLTYSDSGLAAGTYYYVVSASTPSGTTANSNEAKAVVGVQLHTHLAFDESGGTTAADASGQGHAGTLVGGATWVAGKKGNCVSLNGSTGYVSLPAGIMSDVADATIACWVYWNASQTWARVFDFGSGTGHYMFLTPRANDGLPRFAITVNGGSNSQAIAGNAALPTGQWVHVAVTLSGGTGKLYVNGAQAGINTGMFLAPFRLQNTTRNWIGRSQYPDPYFNGKIDEFRIYRGALSATEVAALMTA